MVTFKEELNKLIAKHEKSNKRGCHVRAKFIKGSINNFERTMQLMKNTSAEEVLPAVVNKYNYEEQDMYLANTLLEHIRNNLQSYKTPNLKSWADDIRKIRTIDGYTKEIIYGCIVWCQQDSFWHKNILSAGKLREKLPQLLLKIKSENVPDKKKKPSILDQLD